MHTDNIVAISGNVNMPSQSTTVWFLLPMLLFSVATATEYKLHVDMTKIIGETMQEYLSVCLDPYLKHDLTKPWGTLDFASSKLHTLLKGLAPAVLRFGGTDADWSVFYDVTSADQQQAIWKLTSQLTDVESGAFVVPIFPQDIDNLISLAESANGKLLFDLNMQQRFGSQWDATNALQLMQYVYQRNKTESVFFELGNEPNYPQFNFTGERIAKDFQILRRVMNFLPAFKSHPLVGPDIGIVNVPWLLKIMTDFVKYAANTVSAITIHHYYFKGPGAKLEQYYNVDYFHAYEQVLTDWRDAIYQAAGYKIPIWVGETSDSYNKGSENITNRYVSGLLWLDKLGLSAKVGAKLVARQDLYGGNYPLLSDSLNPNPDYWLSHVFKRLVGVHVLNATVTSEQNSPYLRVYAHCSCTNNAAQNVTLFMLNLNPNETAVVHFDEPYRDYMKVYYMTPGEGGLLSPEVMLNGRVLKLIDDYTLPELKPLVVETKAGVKIKPLTFAFVVFDTKSSILCRTNK